MMNSLNHSRTNMVEVSGNNQELDQLLGAGNINLPVDVHPPLSQTQ